MQSKTMRRRRMMWRRWMMMQSRQMLAMWRRRMMIWRRRRITPLPTPSKTHPLHVSSHPSTTTSTACTG